MNSIKINGHYEALQISICGKERTPRAVKVLMKIGDGEFIVQSQCQHATAHLENGTLVFA